MHPSDATLQALIDRELSAAETAVVRAHLADCAECAASAAALRMEHAEIGRLLEMLDHPVPNLGPPRETRRAPGFRQAALAASLALVVAGAAAAAVPGTPINRWIRSHFAAPATPAAPDVRPVPAPAHDGPVSAPLAQEAGGVEVPVSHGLTIAFALPEPTGLLTVATAERSDASLLAYGGSVSYQVGDGRITVDNHRPAARYALRVPPGLSHLTVLVAGRVAYDGPGLRAGAALDTIPLSPEPAR